MLSKITSGAVRYIGQRLGLILVFAGILFSCAGRWNWTRGWAYVVTVLVLEGGTLCLLAAWAPETLSQRGTGHSGIKSFDKVFAVLWLAFALGTPAVAGLDAVRFHWSSLPRSMFYIGLMILVLAFVFGTWAMLENEHFEQFVRIQEEREHRVVTTGPYRFVRHPGYLAAILGAVATPLMLGSAWTFIPAGLVGLLFVVRTHLEDETLRRELDGYEEYSSRTRFRLLPALW